jgi:uncharacterized protein YceK
MKLKSLSLVIILLVVCLVVIGCGTTTTTNANKTTSNANAVVAKTTLTTDKTSYKAGDTIQVTYKIVEPLKTGAWIGIVPSTTKHGLEIDGDAADIDWKYLEGSTAGTFTFNAPANTGSYDFRVYDTENTDGVELGSVTFTVTE